MRFNLVDRIVEVQPGRSLQAVKNLTLGEEYLADHFPTFPVMPGVLMLETLVEAGAWHGEPGSDATQPVTGGEFAAGSRAPFVTSVVHENPDATVLATNILQALLVTCVVLWVLDVPRQLLNVSFYTEQLLAVTLGLTLALAFITETS